MATPENINFPAALNDAAEKLPNLTDILEPDHPGMHTTGLVQALICGRPWSRVTPDDRY
jgi:hypothetical protein